jgi:hypothetical protein
MQQSPNKLLSLSGLSTAGANHPELVITVGVARLIQSVTQRAVCQMANAQKFIVRSIPHTHSLPCYYPKTFSDIKEFNEYQ